jgi:predicted alpha/beta hydrolase
MEPSTRAIKVVASDGPEFTTLVYDACDNAERGRPILMWTPAMGVTASFYRPFAQTLAVGGLGVALTDLRGAGLSPIRADRRNDFGYSEVVGRDLPAIWDALKREYPGRRVLVGGHSLGGQMSCLFAATNPEVEVLILVACCSVYYRGWPFPTCLGVLAFERFAAFTARVWGHFPGRLFRFGGREARSLVRDWASQGTTGRYTARRARIDYEPLLEAAELSVFSLSFTDDGYCPEKAVAHLLGKMKRARVTHRRMRPQDLGLESVGHFDWARRPEQIAPIILEWVTRLT